MNQNLILSKLNSLQKLKEKQKFWNITWEQGIFISNLVKIKNPKSVLEIGTSNGFSTLWLAKNLSSKAKITTIEVNKERSEQAKKNFEFCKLDNIECICLNVFEVIENFKEKFDFIFIDAEQEHYLNLLQKIEELNLLERNGIILFDNILNHDSTKDFPNQVSSSYHKEIIDIGAGMLFLQKN